MPQRPLSSLRGPRDLQAELHARYAEEMLPKVIQARARTRDSTRIHMQCVMSIPNPAPLRPCRAAVARDCTAAAAQYGACRQRLCVGAFIFLESTTEVWGNAPFWNRSNFQ
jgi:hypothetical protein